MPAALRRLAALAALLCLAAGLAAQSPGFRSRSLLDSHYLKHVREFGNVSKDDYLRMAQDLRDARLSAQVVEFVREDGVITRFHRGKGWFGAYNPDRTIRTFFIPRDGEMYFKRQARRPRQ
ncbi:MAG TPA: hypothetical protein DEH78_10360 [Solibacterales bacterium]|nr:hypothetical protein [Bryobacterales bacterium]